MEKTILVQYHPFGADQPLAIPVSYKADTAGAILTLSCKVELPLAEAPWWLRPLKFELRAACEGNGYQLLMNDTRNVHTVDAALFMDKVQEEIVAVEKLKGRYITH